MSYAEDLIQEINNGEKKKAPVINLFEEVKGKMSKEDLDLLKEKKDA